MKKKQETPLLPFTGKTLETTAFVQPKGEPLFKCYDCGTKFYSKRDLESHECKGEK